MISANGFGFLTGNNFYSSCASTDFTSTVNLEFIFLPSYADSLGLITVSTFDAFIIPINIINAKATNLTNIYLGNNEICYTLLGYNIIVPVIPTYYIPY
jgi:hypothetical protein